MRGAFVGSTLALGRLGRSTLFLIAITMGGPLVGTALALDFFNRGTLLLIAVAVGGTLVGAALTFKDIDRRSDLGSRSSTVGATKVALSVGGEYVRDRSWGWNAFLNAIAVTMRGTLVRAALTNS